MVVARGPAVGRLGGLFKGKQQQRSIMQRLDAERESYLAIYLRAISEARQAHDVAVAEVKVETTREKFRKPYRHYTLDIFCRRGDKSGPIEVNIAAASKYAAVVASGRSDSANQINNVLVFPGIFRGLLDAQTTQVSDDVLVAAANALANIIDREELNPAYIIPSVFNPDVAKVVAAAVRIAAIAAKTAPQE